MDSRVVWLRDQKRNDRWCVDRKTVLTVEQLRIFCERDWRYAEFPDRSPGFLQLSFKGKPFSNDAITLDQLNYPDYDNSIGLFVRYIEISPIETKLFHITCPEKGILFDIPCHARVLVWDLKLRLSSKFGVSPQVDTSFTSDSRSQSDG
jgi:hypothetical protein